MRRWLSGPSTVALSLVGALVLAPSIGVVFHPQTYTDQIIATWNRHDYCQSAAENPYAPANSIGVIDTQKCIRDGAWETDKLPLVTSVTADTGSGTWYWLTFGGGVVALVLWAAIGSVSIRGRDESRVIAPPDRVEAELSA